MQRIFLLFILIASVTACKKSRGLWAEDHVTLAQWGHIALAQELWEEVRTNGFVDRNLKANVSNLVQDHVIVENFYDQLWYEKVSFYKTHIKLKAFSVPAFGFGDQFIELTVGEVNGFSFDTSFGRRDLGTALGTNLSFIAENREPPTLNPDHSNVFINPLQLELYTTSLDLSEVDINGVIAGGGKIYGDWRVHFEGNKSAEFIENPLHRADAKFKIEWTWHSTPITGQGGGFYYSRLQGQSSYDRAEVYGLLEEALAAQRPQREKENRLIAEGKQDELRAGEFDAPFSLRELWLMTGIDSGKADDLLPVDINFRDEVGLSEEEMRRRTEKLKRNRADHR